MDITVHTDKIRGRADHFWAAAGLDELFPLLNTESGEYLLKRMQTKKTCRYLRNHYTLSTCFRSGLRCGGDVYKEDIAGNPVYDFTWINNALAQMVKYGIKPIVEMDFMPSALCTKTCTVQEGTGEIQTDRYKPNDWEKWSQLLKAFTENLRDTFGIDEIRTWYFEVWNEPDSWPVDTWSEFYRMYDIFVNAVTGVDDQLRVGGPGCFKNSFMHSFLNHITNGKNYITGQKGSRIDFISYHIYGMSGGWLNEYPLIMPTVQRFTQELMWLSRTIDAYPSLKSVEIHLNEWGVVSNYERDSQTYPVLNLRNSEYSALFMVKLVDCIYELQTKYHLPLSMMLYWGFCGEDYFDLLFNGNRSLTTAHHISKPIETAHELLAMMGDQLLLTEGLKPGSTSGCFATKSDNDVQIMLYRFDENDLDGNGINETYNIELLGLPNRDCQADIYIMDGTHHNTYRHWQRMGAKEHLSKTEIDDLINEGKIQVSETAFLSHENKLMLTVPAQSLMLISIHIK